MTNRLITEKSPYLLQHAHNPVDWYPWGEEAFELARSEEKPVFLSIGYSTCHWCHVMAHESFEDAEVAKLLNDTFISIKVDREERPDIDSIYMSVCQMMTGSGGWPLTVMMTPDKRPFLAGTYFPGKSRPGRIGMTELIPRIKDAWRSEHGKVLETAEKITVSLNRHSGNELGEALDKPDIDLAYRALAESFDTENGGFGTAPRFPTPHNISFLLRYWRRTGNPKALQIAEETLESMRFGGIYDHIGYGFHRYSTDAEWLLPHFEKMLYDQALTVMAYTEAYQATGRELYFSTAMEIIEYLLRDMKAPEGAFYSAEDADSEGVEGKYYIWSMEEILQALGPDEGNYFSRIFNVRSDGNFTDEATGSRNGGNILHLKKRLEDYAAEEGMPVHEVQERLDNAVKRLFKIRNNRIHPGKDDKILTDWNGLMAAALARAGQAFDDTVCTDAAKCIMDFILSRMLDSDGSLLHRFRDGEAAHSGCIDDYAFVIWGLIELYEATLEKRYIRNAITLQDYMLKHFRDLDRGGFYFTSDQSEELLTRQKTAYDGALPSGNSIAAINLLRLGRLTGNTAYEEYAVMTGQAFSSKVRHTPSAFTQMLSAVDFSIGPSTEVVIAGDLGKDDTKLMLKEIRRSFQPNNILLFRSDEDDDHDISEFAGFTKGYRSINQKATAFVCRDYKCSLPTTDIQEMMELLED